MKKIVAFMLSLVMLVSMAVMPAVADETVAYRTLYSGEITSLNYLTTATANEFALAANVIDTLVEYNKYGEVQPSLALSWEYDPDNLTYTFKLRQDATWVKADVHQRNVGLPGIVLTDDRVTVELIIDGRHVHSRMVDLACRCKTMRQIIGISDGTMASGMPDGAYHIGPSEIIVKNGFSQNCAGKLAGTTTMLDTGWHSLMSCGHLSETKSAQAVTCNPAEHFGLFDRGQLLPGLRADLAVFERGSNRPLLTVRSGETISKAQE